MKYVKYTVSAALLLTILGCATSATTTFFEQTEPTISIKPFSRDEQEEQATTRRGSLAMNIKKLAPAAVIVPVEVIASPKWTIEKGQPIHTALEAWAKSAGWSLIWYPSVSWKSISNAEMKDQKDVVAAISEVVTILRDEGKPIQLRVSEGNNVMEVLSTEVKND